MAKHPRFEVNRDKAGKFRFNLTAKNGQVILTSQGYAAKAGALNGIASVKKNCSEPGRFESKTGKNGKWHFNLLAANKQVIGSSQMYASKASMENGVDSVRNNAPSAEVEDLA